MPVPAYTIQLLAPVHYCIHTLDVFHCILYGYSRHLDIPQRCQRMSVLENSTQFGKLNLIPNPPTEKDGGRVDIIKRTHIVEKFFVIFNMKLLWLK